MTAVLSVQNATLRFDDRVIWQGLDFAIEPGEFIALIGANGSGKSML
ncbi:MAG: ATP-binding cassette domain-containing protein, partial [Aquiluna sp.]